uniref:Uncharacterized protein n=1 Tax=Vespula pensylvanica TaxID=30213 RepID=A0A834NPZ3_VESPE|nr:hypothetical protein H0235_012006 [Vespula pensylvanica]
MQRVLADSANGVGPPFLFLLFQSSSDALLCRQPFFHWRLEHPPLLMTLACSRVLRDWPNELGLVGGCRAYEGEMCTDGII